MKSNKEIEKIKKNVNATLAFEGLEPSEDASIFNSKMLTGEITGLEARKLILAKYNLVAK
jgi:hypothetical protein